MRHTIKKVFAVTAALLLLASCEKEEAKDYPSVVTDFLVAHTDHEGIVESVTFDNGKTFSNLKQKIMAETPDTIFRCVSIYTLEEGELTLYSLKHIFSDEPADTLEQEDKVYDPVKVVCAWKGCSRYANMQLGIMTTGKGSHHLEYSIDSIVGTTKHISLIHKRAPEDAESYTRELFISLPLHPEDTEINTTVLHVFTYDGWKEYSF